MKTTIISGADSSFFDLLFGLVRSIRACPESREIDLCILDVGLTATQIAQLTPLVTRIVPAQWDVQVPDRDRLPSWYKAMFCRPFFPRYFPDYDYLIWIDADAWLCNWDAVSLLIAAAQNDAIVIIPELDRCYSHCYQLRQDILQNLREAYLHAFGPDAAERFTLMPVLNCGVFGMRREMPYWNIWAKLLADALTRCVQVLIEQCALNVAAYTGQIPVYCLPSWCNWNCAHALPMFNPQTRSLSVPVLPHETISILHLTDVKRDEKSVFCTDGARRQMALTYDSVRLAPVKSPLAD